MRLSILLLLLFASAASAQTTPAPSCEQQLDAATSANLALQKELLQSRYQTITLQEQLREQQKKQAAEKK